MARANVKGKGLVPMMDLQPGDEVMVGDGTYEPIYAFAHYAPTIKASFLQMSTSLGSMIEVTPEHLIFVKDKTDPVRADEIVVGDLLQVASGDDLMSVTEIRFVELEGLFAPLTVDGTIAVEGIKASCYIWTGATPINQHKLTHMTLAPFRWLCSEASFGFCHSYTEKGMPHFVDYGLQLAAWFDTVQANHFVKAIMLMAYLLVIGAMRMIEVVFCESRNFWLPAVFFTVFVTMIGRKNGVEFYVRKVKVI